jgi:hypothetical protein
MSVSTGCTHVPALPLRCPFQPVVPMGPRRGGRIRCGTAIIRVRRIGRHGEARARHRNNKRHPCEQSGDLPGHGPPSANAEISLRNWMALRRNCGLTGTVPCHFPADLRLLDGRHSNSTRDTGSRSLSQEIQPPMSDNVPRRCGETCGGHPFLEAQSSSIVRAAAGRRVSRPTRSRPEASGA